MWAPDHARVEVELLGVERVALQDDGDGCFSGWLARAQPGCLYRLLVPGCDRPLADPASRFQPEGPFGPSQVIDPDAFEWHDRDWPGVALGQLSGRVIYEMHVGTFTAEGSWDAARAELPELARLGVGAVEIMPVAAFAGRFGWGYDGVCLFAPTQLYGTPDDFRRFVDRAHALGIGVVLDVVYNHLGPAGNELALLAPGYASPVHRTDWGAGLDFDGPNARIVRQLVLSNVAHWIREYHLDGLRLDATQDIRDTSAEHIVGAIARVAREAAERRSVFIVAENEPQDSVLVRPVSAGGLGIDGLWNDDFHHACVAAVTGRRDAYYTDYSGRAHELVALVRHGFLYQGQWYGWQNKARGTSFDRVPLHAFINCIENHDQVANTLFGRRLCQSTSPAAYRAMSAFLLLAPGTPMLFQGQEFGATSPFTYFADHEAALQREVAAGRKEFLRQFARLTGEAAQAAIPEPGHEASFRRAKLAFSERERHAPIYALYRDLIALRRSDQALRAAHRAGIDAAVLSEDALVVRYRSPNEDDRLMLLNLGRDGILAPASEPLLAPPPNRGWQLRWSSEDPCYGGSGTPSYHPRCAVWRLLAESALVFAAVADPEETEGSS